jgi:hypothetical protein
LHDTAQIRNPKVRNDQLPLALQQRLNVYRRAVDKKCFDIVETVGDEIAFVILLRLGVDVAARKNSENMSVAFKLLMQEPWKDYTPPLNFLATLHPLSGYTDRDQDDTCPIIYCFKNNLKKEFRALNTKEAMEKLAVEGALTPYITDGSYKEFFNEDDLAHLLPIREGDLDLALNNVVTEAGMRPGILVAVISTLEKGGKVFINKLPFDKVSPFLGAYFVQFHVDEGVPELQYLKQKWRRNLASVFTEQTVFPMDQLPMDMLLLIAEHLLAEDILAVLLTTKSLWQISGSSFWRCYFRAKKLQSPHIDNDTDFMTPAKIGVKWRAGKLVLKYAIKHNDIRLLDKQWAIVKRGKELVAQRWDDASLPSLPGRFVDHYYMKYLVVDSTPHSLTALVINRELRAQLGLMGSTEPVHTFNLPASSYDQNYFMRDKQHLVFGSQLNEMDLQTCQVVTSLPREYRINHAKSNYFDSSTVIALSKDVSNMLLVDKHSRVACTVPVAGISNLLDFYMVTEHHLLGIFTEELRCYDLRYPSQSTHVLNLGSLLRATRSVDVPNHRMIVCSPQHASVMTLDLSSMMWDRVFLAPDLTAHTRHNEIKYHLHDQYLCEGRSDMKVYEMKS